jgi:hypothetical protein
MLIAAWVLHLARRIERASAKLDRSGLLDESATLPRRR